MKTLKDFKQHYDLNKIAAIYLCDNTLTHEFASLINYENIYQEDLTDFYKFVTENYDNIILRDEYLKEEDGKTKVDIDKIFEKFKNYMIVGALPKGDDIKDPNLSFEDVMNKASSYILLLKKKASIPKIVSNVNGFCVFNFDVFDEDVTTSEGKIVSGSQLLCGIFDNEIDAYNYIRKRKNLISVFYRVKKGKPVSSTVRYYKTHSDGFLEELN